MSVPAKAVIAWLRASGAKKFYADTATMRAQLPRHQNPRKKRPPATTRFGVDIDTTSVEGHPCTTLRPSTGTRTGLHVLHLHGGGYVEEIEPHHWRFGRWLATTLGCTVTFPLYPLAPAHDHHTIWPMVWHSYQRFLAPHPPHHRVILGDSAGGALALTIAQLLRDHGEEQPARLGLFSPWLDLAVSDPLSARIDPHDPLLGVTGLRQAGRWYAAGTALDNPEISPVHADLTGLAPIHIFAGTRDLLLPDARLLHHHAHHSGTTVTLHEYPGMFHNWIMQPIPEARPARRQLLHYIS